MRNVPLAFFCCVAACCSTVGCGSSPLDPGDGPAGRLHSTIGDVFDTCEMSDSDRQDGLNLIATIRWFRHSGASYNGFLDWSEQECEAGVSIAAAADCLLCTRAAAEFVYEWDEQTEFTASDSVRVCEYTQMTPLIPDIRQIVLQDRAAGYTYAETTKLLIDTCFSFYGVEAHRVYCSMCADALARNLFGVPPGGR